MLKNHPFIRKYEITINVEPSTITDVNTSLITNVNSFILAAKANLMAKEIVKASDNLPTEPNMEKKESSHTPKSPLAMFKQRSSPVVMSRPFNPMGQVGLPGLVKNMHHLHPGGFTEMTSSPKGETSPIETPNRSIIVDTNLAGTAKFKELRHSEKPKTGDFDTPRLSGAVKPNKDLVTPGENDVSFECADDIIKMQEQLLREMMETAQPVPNKPPPGSETFGLTQTFGAKQQKAPEAEMDEEELLREQDRLLREMMGEAVATPPKSTNNPDKYAPEAEMDVDELLREQERLLAEMMGGIPEKPSDLPKADKREESLMKPTGIPPQKSPQPDEMDVDELMEEQNRLLMEMMAGDQKPAPTEKQPIHEEESLDMDSEELLKEQERLLMEMMGTDTAPQTENKQNTRKSLSIKNKDIEDQNSEDIEQMQQRLLEEMMGHAAKNVDNQKQPSRLAQSERSISNDVVSIPETDRSEVIHEVKNEPSQKAFLEDQNLQAAKPIFEKLAANLKDEMISEESEKSASESVAKRPAKTEKFNPVPLEAIKSLPFTRNISNTSKLLTHAVSDQIMNHSKSNRPSLFIPEGAVLTSIPEVSNANNQSPESSAFTSPKKTRGKVSIRYGSNKKEQQQTQPRPPKSQPRQRPWLSRAASRRRTARPRCTTTRSRSPPTNWMHPSSPAGTRCCPCRKNNCRSRPWQLRNGTEKKKPASNKTCTMGLSLMDTKNHADKSSRARKSARKSISRANSERSNMTRMHSPTQTKKTAAGHRRRQIKKRAVAQMCFSQVVD